MNTPEVDLTKTHPILLVGGGYGLCAHPAGHAQGCKLVGDGTPAFTVALGNATLTKSGE